MIMVPAHDHDQNYFKQQNQHDQQKINHCSISDGYVIGCGGASYRAGTLGNMSGGTSSPWYDYGGRVSEACLGSDHRMAEDDESRSSSTTTITKDDDDDDQNNYKDDKKWLQLGLGDSELPIIEPTTAAASRTDHDLIELNLFSASANYTQHMKPLPLITVPISTRFSTFIHQQRQEVSSYNPWNVPTGAASTSSSLLQSNLPPTPTMMMNMYYPQRFHHHPNTVLDIDVVGPSCNSDFRVVDPPRRPHSGVWVILQASQRQEKEPFLPQIPKNYLRIKDGRTTVRLLMKYLVNKLGLNSESEIEIRCRGEELEPVLTIQHVRDNIWITSSSSSSSNSRSSEPSSDHPHHHHAVVVTLLPNTSPTHHVMILHYGTR